MFTVHQNSAVYFTILLSYQLHLECIFSVLLCRGCHPWKKYYTISIQVIQQLFLPSSVSFHKYQNWKKRAHITSKSIFSIFCILFKYGFEDWDAVAFCIKLLLYQEVNDHKWWF